MSMNDFPEPDVHQTAPVSVFLEKLAVSPENKEWLLSLFVKDKNIDFDFKDRFLDFINEINEEDAMAFTLLFLFDFCVSNSDYFVDSKLLSERIKIIPALFTRKTDGKPSVFKPYIANILDNIRKCAEKDKNFHEAYQKSLQEIRSDSSFEERAVCYVKLVFQNLPKRTYKKDEKPPTREKVNSFFDFWEEDFFKNMSDSIRLIAELEEMPENELYINYLYPEKLTQKYNIPAFPFIVCGKELYSCIHRTMYLLKQKTLGQKISADDFAQIRIPCWNANNYIHEVFFELARIFNDKDISLLILDKIFEGINAVDIPCIFFQYIEDNAGSIYGSLLKGGYSEVIEPVRAELEYLDWALTTGVNDPHKIYFDKSRLFLDYIDKLSQSAPKEKIELFQELFFQGTANDRHFQTGKFWAFREKTIKDILDRAAREIIHGEWTFPERQKEANALYEEFVDVIAKGAAKYPLELFLPEERQNLPMQNQNDHALAVFKRYCGALELKNSEDALFVSKFWFNRFHFEQLFSSPLQPSHGYFSGLEEKEAFFYKNVFLKFINDEDFIRCFLSIPQNFHGGHFLSAYYLACWVLYQNNDENVSDVFNKASEKLLHGRKITFPEKTAEFIQSYKIPDELLNNGYDNEAARFLFYLSAALGGGRYQGILKNFHNAKDHFPLYLIRYNYSHEKFVQEEFLDFLFSLKNPDCMANKNEFYNLEIIREACKEKKNHEAQIAFFTRFCERAAREDEDSCAEFYMFLKIRSYFRNKIDAILEKNADINSILVTRCCKMLNNFKKNIEQKKFPDDEYAFLNDYILPASDFVWERTGNIWKALKPIILAFRASKDILLNESLNITNKISYLFLNMITSFFVIDDREKLKELRYNMANDFAEYLKPAKNERQAEKYTQIEREDKGFDLSYTEPSPYWRYAYIRAMGDLGIKTDKRGHYFHKILENVSERDPSEKVKSAAKKVMEGLDSIRNGYSGANHKKCLFEAFWWLKNAHMLSLGGKVDDKKALELRNKEWR